MANFTPGPWHTDEGTIRSAEGYALATYPHNLGDETDRNNGELMAAAPELLSAISLTLRTIYDVLRHYEAGAAGNIAALEDVAADLQKLIAPHYQDKPRG